MITSGRSDQATRVTPGAFRFILLIRWVLVPLTPILMGLSQAGMTGLWWIVGLLAFSNLVLQARAGRPQAPRDSWLWFLAFQFDLFLITLGVVLRGGLRSDVFLFYILVSIEAGLLLGTRQAFLTNLVAISLYATGVLGFTDDVDPKRLVIRCVYLLLFGLVITYVLAAEKRALRNSLTDVKTHLPNFRYFQSVLAEEVRFCSRTGTPLSVAIIDVDNFKRLNATIGHPLADKVLEQFAAMLVSHLRPCDTIARYGGEEFVVLLPGCDESQAYQVLERVRAAVAAHPFLVRDESRDTKPTPVSITLSGGVAEVDPGAPPDRALVRADQALQLAKRSGKNRVMVNRRGDGPLPQVRDRPR